MGYDYFKHRFDQLNQKVNKKGYDYMAMTLDSINKHKSKLKAGIKFVHINDILVNKTTHSQYFYDTQNPEPAYNVIKSEIKQLEGVLNELKKAKKEIIHNCENESAKKRMLREEFLQKLLKDKNHD